MDDRCVCAIWKVQERVSTQPALGKIFPQRVLNNRTNGIVSLQNTKELSTNGCESLFHLYSTVNNRHVSTGTPEAEKHTRRIRNKRHKRLKRKIQNLGIM